VQRNFTCRMRVIVHMNRFEGGRGIVRIEYYYPARRCERQTKVS
jgi:hypothetical protein